MIFTVYTTISLLSTSSINSKLDARRAPGHSVECKHQSKQHKLKCSLYKYAIEAHIGNVPIPTLFPLLLFFSFCFINLSLLSLFFSFLPLHSSSSRSWLLKRRFKQVVHRSLQSSTQKAVVTLFLFLLFLFFFFFFFFNILKKVNQLLQREPRETMWKMRMKSGRLILQYPTALDIHILKDSTTGRFVLVTIVLLGYFSISFSPLFHISLSLLLRSSSSF